MPVLLALALTGLGYGSPWVLSMLYEVPQVPRVRIERTESSVAVQVVIRPPAPKASSPDPPEVVSAQPPLSSPEVVRLPSPVLGQRVPVVVGLNPIIRPRPMATAVGRERPPGSQSAAAEKRSKKRPRKRRPCEPTREEIVQVTDRGYRVEDGMVAYYAEHPRESEKLASTWWNKDEAGERDGFKVGRVRCGTLLHQLGLRGGDAVMAINGKKIQSYADGVTAYLRVRHKQLIWVDVVRKGEPLRLDYLLVAEGFAEPQGLADAMDPTALVEQELALGELPWLKRRKGRRVHKSRLRQAAASARDLGLPGVAELTQLEELPAD